MEHYNNKKLVRSIKCYIFWILNLIALLPPRGDWGSLFFEFLVEKRSSSRSVSFFFGKVYFIKPDNSTSTSFWIVSKGIACSEYT